MKNGSEIEVDSNERFTINEEKEIEN